MTTFFYQYDDGACHECCHPHCCHGGYHNDGPCDALVGAGRCQCPGYELRTVPNLPCRCGHLREVHDNPPYDPAVNDICCADDPCTCEGYESRFPAELVAAHA